MDSFLTVARARTLIELRRYDDALAALTPALGDPTVEAEAWCLRTQALLGKGDVKEALAAARAAVEVSPEDEWPHRLHALALQYGGNHRAALRSAQEAARISPHQAETLHVLAICLANRRKKADADETVNRLMEQHPHAPLAHQTAGAVAAARRDWAAAERHLRESLRREPNDPDASAALAEALTRQGRRQEAGEALLAAGRADPTNSSIRKSLGRLGLPLAGFVGFGSVKVLLPLQLLRLVDNVRPAIATIVVTAFFVLVGGYLNYARVSGTRGLPDHVHRGLMSDHRNYALGWLGSAAIVSIPLAAWAAAAPADQGRSTALATGLVMFSVVALTAVLTLWTGPFPRPFARTTAWFARLWHSHRT